MYDRLILPMTLDYLFKKGNCFHQLKEIQSRKDTDVASKLMNNLKNHCSRIHERPLFENQDMQCFVCPCNHIHPLAITLVQLANGFKNGILPYDGGMLDQPVILMELLQICNTFFQEYEEKQIKEQQKRSVSSKR